MAHRLICFAFAMSVLGLECHAADLAPAAVTAPPQIEQAAPPVLKSVPPAKLDSILVFGGVLTNKNMSESLNTFGTSYDRNYIVGAAYDHQWVNLYSSYFIVSGQVGLADRFGSGDSVELWGGVHFQSRIPIADVLYITPGLTVGLSGVSDCQGIECQRQTSHNGNAHLLFYFSPEIAFTLQQYPDIDLVYQLHHRSGAGGTLGKMEEGTNANVGGIRYHF